MIGNWQGENPFFLVIRDVDGKSIGIDLDTPGWSTTNAEYMRTPGTWHLVHKETSRNFLVVHVLDGEQPYYTARHLGKLGGGGSNEIVSYGIGKKQVDGSMVRLWVLPDGTVCGGDDVDMLGIEMVERLGPR